MIRHVMRQAEVVRRTGANRDELRYFEYKGFVQPKRVVVKTRAVKHYTENDVRLIELIVKYRREQYVLDAAYEKAKEDLQQPRLL